ncbi:DNA phosphorothioation-dependent restriction protein DptF [Fictibacillus nanhaiensis]|uniref:DNA phosphorothioation-dependent restriction protein DptF n=1 Tax=Fictibacillus nanhaiensis TaxID=742169 RepID=UPI001C982AA1|nr:DNA phosphorothioation-dependent restriction protein DptF [Fictibacillus nanhaiensis]MBY6036650.1 DNA phosphorothioation-dependent restriction protein DptF [Fictibacillus nanhaiensis]
MEKDYLLKFLETSNKIGALNAEKMEHLIYEDPSSALVKARLFAEEILSSVLKTDGISDVYLSTMHDKVSYLSKEGYIKKDIHQAFDTIRHAGNKAAHDGSFYDIAEALKVHKVMYTIGVWFCEVYSNELVTIPPYKQPKPNSKSNINIDQLKKEIMDALTKEDKENNKLVNSNVEKNTNANEIFKKDLGDNQSYLNRELKRLQESAQEAVENVNSFSTFKNYMHVERKLQKDFEGILEKAAHKSGRQLVLLCGSVGDGKSHLLAYLKSNRNDLLSQFTIYNDATESFSPNKNAMETLEEILQPFADQNHEHSNEKIILAINLGVLHNFIYYKHLASTFETLISFVNESGLFSQDTTTVYSNEDFNLLSFNDYHPYELTEHGAQSSFYSAILNKIFNQNEENPFYLAYLEDKKSGIRSEVHQNFEFLMDEFVQHQIVQVIIQAIIQYKIVISARSFMNFIADIIVPEDGLLNGTPTEFEKLNFSVPNLLFNRRDRSEILRYISLLDPIHYRSHSIDIVILQLNTLTDWATLIEEYILTKSGRNYLDSFKEMTDLEGDSFQQFCEMFIRLSYLTNKSFVKSIENSSFKDYLKNLYYFNSGINNEIEKFYYQIKSAIFKWKSSPKKDYLYINKPNEKIRLAQYLTLRPVIDHLKPNREQVLYSFKPIITIGYRNNNNSNERAYLDIDFVLYSLLLKVIEGYCPNKKDEEDAIKFGEFLERLMKFGNKKEELLVHFPNDQKLYALKKNDFGSFVFEKE